LFFHGARITGHVVVWREIENKRNLRLRQKSPHKKLTGVLS
jgi:hypothetical protein